MNAVTIAQRPVVTLDDKWETDRGRVFINGTQALARVLLAQKMLDEKAGLRTAGYISGYRGSPLGNVDTTLWSIADRLKAAEITFRPGVNEDLAATAVRGTQQLEALPNPLYDGVFAAWYGKGPGIDRSVDAIKHGNFAGAHAKGGVVVFYGDDHGGKSSSVAHHSEQAVASALVPSLYPSDAAEIIEYGLYAYAMSRYSGSWVALKLVNEVVEQTMSADVDVASFAATNPPFDNLPPEGVHLRAGAYGPLREEEIVSDHRLPMVRAFVRANGLDRTIFRADTPLLGLVTAGKTYNDTRQALALLQLDHPRAANLGISLYKLGSIWPIEPDGITDFARDHQTLFVVEEKKSFVEQQVAEILFNSEHRPKLIGKRDEAGDTLLPPATQLEPIRIAIAIAERLRRLGVSDAALDQAAGQLGTLLDLGRVAPKLPLERRSPYFCSGCPHNRSTRIPEGSMSLTGIGCHTMVNFARPSEALLPTHMGGEGANWIGLAPFTGTQHVFQNMGDGTYYHSGLLAIRAAIASGVNITYKILYNDAVAMTGGQPVDGPISVAEIIQQVMHEGVTHLVLVSDNPELHRQNADLPKSLRIEHRDDLDAVQRDLREVAGCSVIVYEQTCAAEKRRRRKRKQFVDPPKRLFISEAVCEGCGDCSVQSTCVSIQPVKTGFGTKRRIDQSSCNKDYSCANGFCPSFITVRDAEPRKPAAARLDNSLFADLPDTPRFNLSGGTFNMMVAGIGGTGVITVAAVLGMAAHIEGAATSLFDMTGLAQKNGAVFSHVRIAANSTDLHAQKLGRGEVDVLLAFDLVAATAPDAAMTYANDRTKALVNSDVVPTVAFQFNRDATIDTRLLFGRLTKTIGKEAITSIDATGVATALLGDTIGVNMFMVGVAAQRGYLPIGVAAIEEAIRLNGTAVEFNLKALKLGRLFVAAPENLAPLLPQPAEVVDDSLEAVMQRYTDRLTQYQDAAYAGRYMRLVETVRAAEARITPSQSSLAAAVARNYGRLLAYKDEYEVARLLTSPELQDDLKRNFADGAKLSFNLAPPILGGKKINGRPHKREFSTRWMLPAMRILAKGKRVRGTALDVFGYTRERKMERALIREYENLVEQVIASMTPNNYAQALGIFDSASSIRGYGVVKDTAVEAYRHDVDVKLQAFLNTPRTNAKTAA